MRIAWLGPAGFALMVLLVLHSKLDAEALLGLRVSFLFAVVVGWRYCVDSLTEGGWVHPMRRPIVMASRWHVLGLFAIVEIFVIQQAPQLVREILRI